MDRLNPFIPQQRPRPDAGKLEKLGRIDCPAAQDDLALGLRVTRLATNPVVHTDGAAALEDHP